MCMWLLSIRVDNNLIHRNLTKFPKGFYQHEWKRTRYFKVKETFWALNFLWARRESYICAISYEKRKMTEKVGSKFSGCSQEPQRYIPRKYD